MSERFKLISAAHLLVFQGDKILLLKRQNTGYEDGNYSVPAGHHDAGESMSTTAIRELKEETDLDVAKEDLQSGCVMHRKKPSGDESIDYFFIIKKWSGTLRNCEPEHCSELDFFSLDHLPSNVIPYIKIGIQASMRKEPMVEFGW